MVLGESLDEDPDPSTLRYSTFKITLWKVDQQEPPIILAEQKIEISKEVFVLKNKIHFTQDGKYIFLVFADVNRNLWRSITLDA